jgi:hypothetical protein
VRCPSFETNGTALLPHAVLHQKLNHLANSDLTSSRVATNEKSVLFFPFNNGFECHAQILTTDSGSPFFKSQVFSIPAMASATKHLAVVCCSVELGAFICGTRLVPAVCAPGLVCLRSEVLRRWPVFVTRNHNSDTTMRHTSLHQPPTKVVSDPVCFPPSRTKIHVPLQRCAAIGWPVVHTATNAQQSSNHHFPSSPTFTSPFREHRKLLQLSMTRSSLLLWPPDLPLAVNNYHP